MKQIKINNLLWDEENLNEGGYEYEGNHYYTFDEAQEAAKKQGKRCPTPDEFEALTANGYKWDKELEGMWFAKEKGGDPKEGIFFKAAGYRDVNAGRFAVGDVLYVGGYGYYWSGVPNSDTNGFTLYFGSSTVNSRYSNYRNSRFTVRLVQDIEQPDPEDPSEPMGEAQTTANDRERPGTTAKSSAVYATSAVSAVRENRNEDAPSEKTEAEEVIERLIAEREKVKEFMKWLRNKGERLNSEMWDDADGYQYTCLGLQLSYMRNAYGQLGGYDKTLSERITDLQEKMDNG